MYREYNTLCGRREKHDNEYSPPFETSPIVLGGGDG